MTLEDVISKVSEHAGMTVTADTEVSKLGLDSLEFLDMVVDLEIPDGKLVDINTVRDLYDNIPS
jgi:acyl carrier protein